MFDPEEFDSALDDLEVRLERLNLRYERFFSGSERTEPAALREEIDRQLAELLSDQAHAGALAGMRLTVVHQRYDAYQQCWKRLASRAGAHPQTQPFNAESTPPSRATLVLRESGSFGEGPRTQASRQLVTPVTGLTGSFTRSSRPLEGTALTPPLGTPSSPPTKTLSVSNSKEPVIRASRPESSRTIRDFRQPLARESVPVRAELTPPFEPSAPQQPLMQREPRASLAPEGVPNPEAKTDAPRAVSMERVREIHARLRASNGRPPSLERLAKRLSETEAKLKALHGDRTVTFDVVLKDGKAVVKPIVH